MEYRYMGFEQLQNSRVYSFDGIAKGEATRRFVVTANMALFLTHGVGIQEGPSLCASKIAATLDNNPDGRFELTGDDLRAHAYARTAAEARKAEARKSPVRRTATGRENSPWRNAGGLKPTAG
jgi:hypothetical protein